MADDPLSGKDGAAMTDIPTLSSLDAEPGDPLMPLREGGRPVSGWDTDDQGRPTGGTPRDEAPHPADDPAEVDRHEQQARRAQVTKSEVWEDPLPLTPQATALPAFPLGVLPAWVRNMVQAVARNADTPADVAAFAALGTLSTATGRRAWISAKNQRVPVNFYGVTGLVSGQRKSGPFAAIANVPLLGAQKVLQGDEDSRAQDAKEEPCQVRLFSTNATPAGLRELMAANGQRMAVVSSEGGVFQELAGRYDRIPDLDLVLSGYDGHPFNADRATKIVCPMDEPILTMSLTVQPAVLKEMSGQAAFRDRGLLARLLYGLPEDVVGFRKNERIPVRQEVADAYYGRMTRLLVTSYPWLKADWSLSDAAWKIFHESEQKVEVKLRPGAEYGTNDGMREWASKFTGHILRLTGLLHAAEHCDAKASLQDIPHRVSEGTMRRGLTAMEDYFLPHAEATFGLMRMDPMAQDAETVLDWIRSIDWTGKSGGHLGATIASHPGIITRREVVTSVRAIGTTDQAATVLHLLEKAGYVRLTEAERRDSVRYLVHPSLKTSALSALADFDDVAAGQSTNQSADRAVCALSALAPLEPSNADSADRVQTPTAALVNTVSPAETEPEPPSADSADAFRYRGASANRSADAEPGPDDGQRMLTHLCRKCGKVVLSPDGTDYYHPECKPNPGNVMPPRRNP
jgi:replicative DNA helicase